MANEKFGVIFTKHATSLLSSGKLLVRAYRDFTAALGIRKLSAGLVTSSDVSTGAGYGSRCEDCVCVATYDHFSAIRGVSEPTCFRSTCIESGLVRVSFDSDYSCEGGASLFFFCR